MDSALQNNAAETYRTALKAGRRAVAEQHSSGNSGLLSVLEPLLSESCGEVSLGLYEIPVKKIRGTYAVGRSSAFTVSFLPLLPEDSEFAAKWQSLYASALERGITEAIRVYEYIGYYYVLEGHKRVSVARELSNYSLLAEVTRLLPSLDTETGERAVFAEILNGNRKKVIRHMWFSEPGRCKQLRELYNTGDETLEDMFTSFRQVYHKHGFHQSIPKITTGDAFWQYAKIYGLPLPKADSELQKNVVRCRSQWDMLANPEQVKTVSDPSQLAPRPFITFARSSAPPSVAFAYCGTPETRFSAMAHDVGRFALHKAFPDLPVSVISGLPAGNAAYEPLIEGLKKENILFVTDPALSGAALRTTLEHRNLFALLCHDDPSAFPGIYYAKTEEAAFLMGVIAGLYSSSARMGWICPPHYLGGRARDVQAFAQGARTVRPSSCIYMSHEPLSALLKRWAERGIDTLILPHTTMGTRPAAKSFPGVYAHICSLSRNGTIAETLASAAWHWDAFYCKFMRGIIENNAQAEHLNFRLGLDSGVLDVHPAVSASGAAACLRVFRNALIEGQIVPIDENMPVEVHEG